MNPSISPMGNGCKLCAGFISKYTIEWFILE